MAALGILHHGLTVCDIDAAVVWYTDLLGLEVVHRQRQENRYTEVLVGVENAVLEVAQLRVPGASEQVSTHQVELIQYVAGSVPGQSPAVNQVGASHLAFVVDDAVALARKAETMGARLRNPPVKITAGANAGGLACYLHDPDGNTLEFLQPSAARLAELTGRKETGRKVTGR